MQAVLPRQVDDLPTAPNLKLSVDDLIPDAANDVVFLAAETISRVEIHTPDPVVARGSIDAAAADKAHAGLDFIRLASGIRLLFPPSLLVVAVFVPRKAAKGG